jgi:hypothetical protein
MQPEGSLPQRPDTGPCPEPFESSPYFHVLFIEDSSHLCLDLSSGLFPWRFPTEYFMYLSFFPSVLHVNPTILDFTTLMISGE